MPALFDNLVALRSLEAGPHTQRYISIIKMRGCRYDDAIYEYVLDKGRIALGEMYRHAASSSPVATRLPRPTGRTAMTARPASGSAHEKENHPDRG